MRATSFRGLPRLFFDNSLNPSATSYFGGGCFTNAWAQDGLWRTRAVTPGATFGSLTPATGSMSAVVNGQTVAFSGTVSVTSNGTADGSLTLPLLYTPTTNSIAATRNQSTCVTPLIGIVNAGDPRVLIQTATGLYPGGNNTTLTVSGSYPIAP